MVGATGPSGLRPPPVFDEAHPCPPDSRCPGSLVPLVVPIRWRRALTLERSFGVRAACCRFFPSQLAGWNGAPGEAIKNRQHVGLGVKFPQASLREGERQQAARTPKLRAV